MTALTTNGCLVFAFAVTLALVVLAFLVHCACIVFQGAELCEALLRPRVTPLALAIFMGLAGFLIGEGPLFQARLPRVTPLALAVIVGAAGFPVEDAVFRDALQTAANITGALPI